MKSLEQATLNWHENGTPVSSQFDDVYFSKDNGCAESQYVFVQHNLLDERFAQLEKSHFIIGETGFGTGLNFLNTWQLWRKHAKAGQKLYFISAELHPIKREDLARCLKAWPQFQSLAEKLLANYPPLLQGMHCLELDANTCLILLFDDVLQGFSQLLENQHPNLSYADLRSVDAWFLDGFAPAKNEAMWRDELFQLMGQLSHRQTTIATFTSAGFVKRGLQAAGFVMRKTKGFGRKREMLVGNYQGLPLSTMDDGRAFKDCGPFWPIHRNPRPIKTVLVIGAGISGCTTAKSLSDAGLTVTLIDSAVRPMQEASGNPQAVLFPKLSIDEEKAFAHFNLLSLLYAWRYYQQDELKANFHACGLLDVFTEKDAAKQYVLAEQLKLSDEIARLCTPLEASALAGTAITQEAMFYPRSGWIDTQYLADTFTQNQSFQFIGNQPIESIELKDAKWHAKSHTDVFSADAIVLCNAQAANNLLKTALPTRNIRGQITGFQSNKAPLIKRVICQSAYICPPIDQQFRCGASFDLHNHDAAPSLASQQQNLQQIAQVLTDFSSIKDEDVNFNRVNFRCCAPDYMPVTGPIAEHDMFLQDYAKYRKNARAYISKPGSYIPGLFINNAMGSRGFSSAPICAALIRSYITEQPFPMPFSTVSALSPARFVIRQLNQNK